MKFRTTRPQLDAISLVLFAFPRKHRRVAFPPAAILTHFDLFFLSRKEAKGGKETLIRLRNFSEMFV